MPDDLDYERLRELLAAPEDWTDENYSYIDFLRRQHRDSLAETPPHYFEYRRRLEGVIAELESAIRRFDIANPS